MSQVVMTLNGNANASSSLGDDQRAVVVEARPSRANRQVHGKKKHL